MKTLFKLHIYFLIALLLVQFIPNQTLANESNSSTDTEPLEVVLSSEDPELPIELFEDASEEIVLTTIEEGTTVEFLEEEETFSLILYTEENTEEEPVEWTGYVLTSNVIFPIKKEVIDADPATEEATEGAIEDDSYIVNKDEVVANEEETAVVEKEETEFEEDSVKSFGEKEEIQVDAEEIPAEGETSVNEEEPGTEEKEILEEEAEGKLEMNNIHQTLSIVETNTSRIGHINSSSVRIYTNLNDLSKYIPAGTAYTHEVYYIKKQANHNGELYYLISRNPSSTSGVAGWVKAKDMKTFEHAAVDSVVKSFVISGTSHAYDKPWGGRKNISFENLSIIKGSAFTVSSTERVGDSLWHQGLVNGKTVWIQETHLNKIEDSEASLIGHINSSNVRIYENISNQSVFVQAGSAYTHEVYYIKRQATYSDEKYYLISRSPSSTEGVAGWVRASDMNAFDHSVIDSMPKTFFIKGTSHAYEKPWGGRKNISYENLSTLKGQEFHVTLTEQVGNSMWHLGSIDGRIAWIQESHLENLMKTESISLIGHLNSGNAKIYANPVKPNEYVQAGTAYTHEVYYIKKQATYRGDLFYQINRTASAASGAIGWVKATDMKVLEHTIVESTINTFLIKGTSHAYEKPWGGRKNIAYENLITKKDTVFNVISTEQVGTNVWHQGTIDGKTAWIQESHLKSVVETNKTSRMGHINSSSVRIYADVSDQKNFVQAGSAHTHEVYYIKLEAILAGEKYYLVSRNPSDTTGVAGWIKATDMKTFVHEAVDTVSKTFFLKGTSHAYEKPWGGRKNISYENLSTLKGAAFLVTATERVGNDLWYRGSIEGKIAWVHENNLTDVEESSVSLLGHISSSNVRIYETYLNPAKYVQAGTAYTHEVYYIKKQAKYAGEIYYLISRNPSSTSGVAGWVKSSDMNAFEHVVVDNAPKTFYIKGTSHAYDKLWGGRKNISFENLSRIEGVEFNVNLTERVGNSTWHRGTIEGKNVWIHESHLVMGYEIAANRLGHLRSANVLIYKDYAMQNESIVAGTAHTHEVYYIKRQATVNNELFYLISRGTSSSIGVVGWVKASDLSSFEHVTIDALQKTFVIAGTSHAYEKPWGGNKNITYQNLSGKKGDLFEVNLTERVGNDLWHRGIIDGKTAWIHENHLTKSLSTFTTYNLTHNQALDQQMLSSPQTDKYRNVNAFIPSWAVTVTETAAISANGARLRTAPNFNNNIAFTVNAGTKITILGEVTGALSAGSTKWYKISYANRELYAHSSIVNAQSFVGTVVQRVNIYEAANTTSHVFSTLAINTEVQIVNRGSTFHEIKFGAWRNAKRDDVEQYLDPNKNDVFQHLLLTSSAGVTASELNKVLLGKGVLEGTGQAFINGGNLHSVNEIYLISHALLETGQGLSVLATGVEVGVNNSGTAVQVTALNRSSLKNIKVVYNMFGIRAFDNCAVSCGSAYAYTQGWDTPEKAIIGGAKFIGEDYVHNQYGQNTIYKMRWNHIYRYKQYATDIGWAVKQTNQIKNMYSQLTNPVLRFDVSQFR